MYEQGMGAVQVAGLLRVSTKSAYQWRRAWEAGGTAALASKGPGGTGCKLDDGQLARLRAALDAGPAAYGWGEDQRWTLARAATGPGSSGGYGGSVNSKQPIPPASQMTGCWPPGSVTARFRTRHWQPKSASRCSPGPSPRPRR